MNQPSIFGMQKVHIFRVYKKINLEFRGEYQLKNKKIATKIIHKYEQKSKKNSVGGTEMFELSIITDTKLTDSNQ